MNQGQGQNLVLTQKQTLRLSTQMLQSLEIMTLPLSELQRRIETELVENPTLTATDPQNARVTSYEEYYSKQLRHESRMDDSYSDSSSYGSDISDSHNAWLEGAVSNKETLAEHLMWQLGCSKCDENTRRVAEILISNLDENGFHSQDPDSILSEEDRQYKDSALALLHSFDPSGIACSDFRESLVVQAENLGLEGEELKDFKQLVYQELEALKAGRYDEVARRLSLQREELDALYSFLKSLTPYPASMYASSSEHIIIPDLSIKVEDGQLVMRLNNEVLPSLSLDADYQEMAEKLSNSSRKDEKETSRYLKKELASAQDLIRQVSMRNSTLEKVGRVLMVKQKAFFLFGPSALKPLTLKAVAEEVGVHEATVSRITTNKYADTDWGIIPLKSLFSSAIQTTNGEGELSKQAVKEMVKKIISENTGKPLSDQKISDMLKERGISCARRTVNKYRKELNIDSSFERAN